jgi:hypothetical protein
VEKSRPVDEKILQVLSIIVLDGFALSMVIVPLMPFALPAALLTDAALIDGSMIMSERHVTVMNQIAVRV